MKNSISKSLESWLWDEPGSIRGADDAPKYKDRILPLNLTKERASAPDRLHPFRNSASKGTFGCRLYSR